LSSHLTLIILKLFKF